MIPAPGKPQLPGYAFTTPSLSPVDAGMVVITSGIVAGRSSRILRSVLQWRPRISGRLPAFDLFHVHEELAAGDNHFSRCEAGKNLNLIVISR